MVPIDRCFRQHRPFDWKSVAADIKRELELFSADMNLSKDIEQL